GDRALALMVPSLCQGVGDAVALFQRSCAQHVVRCPHGYTDANWNAQVSSQRRSALVGIRWRPHERAPSGSGKPERPAALLIPTSSGNTWHPVRGRPTITGSCRTRRGSSTTRTAGSADSPPANPPPPPGGRAP